MSGNLELGRFNSSFWYQVLPLFGWVFCSLFSVAVSDPWESVMVVFCIYGTNVMEVTNQFLVGSKARIMEWNAHLKQLKWSWNCGYIDPSGESNAINELNEYSIKMTPNDQWEKTPLKCFCKVFLFRRWKIIQWHHSENKRVDKYITALTPVLRDLCGKGVRKISRARGGG